MADAAGNLQEILKPFYRRASEAEDRLARLEASIVSKNSSRNNEELAKLVLELQLKLDEAKTELFKEKEKSLKEAQNLAAENEKLQNRIIHLVRALKEADCKIASI
ncbi:unnamed protein product [Cuscuta campestris]|uniref:Uncharacterized protein n=1 Tax=Cuscuta campestris TaxID=132261 RepID=A0A484L5V4_9ASTE|nr:unnamed protein product [Cuscuta campestris]